MFLKPVPSGPGVGGSQADVWIWWPGLGAGCWEPGLQLISPPNPRRTSARRPRLSRTNCRGLCGAPGRAPCAGTKVKRSSLIRLKAFLSPSVISPWKSRPLFLFPSSRGPATPSHLSRGCWGMSCELSSWRSRLTHIPLCVSASWGRAAAGGPGADFLAQTPGSPPRACGGLRGSFSVSSLGWVLSTPPPQPQRPASLPLARVCVCVCPAVPGRAGTQSSAPSRGGQTAVASVGLAWTPKVAGTAASLPCPYRTCPLHGLDRT